MVYNGEENYFANSLPASTENEIPFHVQISRIETMTLGNDYISENSKFTRSGRYHDENVLNAIVKSYTNMDPDLES